MICFKECVHNNTTSVFLKYDVYFLFRTLCIKTDQEFRIKNKCKMSLLYDIDYL